MIFESSRWGACLFVCATAVACGTATFVVQQYEGEVLDPSRIAILRVAGATDIVVVSLDGEALDYTNDDPNARVHIEMLPGNHEIEVGSTLDPLRRVETVRFLAEPGKVYRLTVESAGGLRPWSPLMWEVDRESDEVLRQAAPHRRVSPSVSVRAEAPPTSPAPAPSSARAPAGLPADAVPPPSASEAPPAPQPPAPSVVPPAPAATPSASPPR